MRFTRAAIVAVIVSLAVSAAAAQSGGLRVVVYDATDHSPLPGATVTLSNKMQYVATTAAITDAKGRVEFPVLRSGSGYAIEVFFPGYGKVKLEDLRVKSNEMTEFPVQLSSEMKETVKVVAKRDVVDLDKTEKSTKFSEDFIQDLPVAGRFITNILTLAPGVQDNNGDGNPTVHGSRSRDFAQIVGGVRNVDPLTGKYMSVVNPDTVEEIEVITAGAGVEFSRAQGGFANVIQKQGSNELEGSFEFTYRSSKLDGNGANDQIPSRYLPDFNWFQPAATVSGPIVKDRVWYALSHMYIHREDPVILGSSGAVQTQKRTVSSDMVTWQVSPRNKLQLQFQQDPLTWDNLGVSSTRPPASAQRLELGGPTYTLRWTAPYSPKILVDSLVAYQDQRQNVLPAQPGVLNDCVIGSSESIFPSLPTGQCQDLNTGQISGSHFRSDRAQSQRFTFRTQATIFGGRFWGMNHQFKLGFDVENERYFRNQERRPFLSFLVASSQGDPNDPNSNIERRAFVNGQFSIPEKANVEATGTVWGLYGEDQIKPMSNLSITLGLRIDRELTNSLGTIPFDPQEEARQFMELLAGLPPGQSTQGLAAGVFTAYENLEFFQSELAVALGVPAGDQRLKLSPTAQQSTFLQKKRQFGDINLANTNFSPLVSISWDPWNNNKTKFSMSARRYYDKIFLDVPVREVLPVTTFLDFIFTPTPGDPEGGTLSSGAFNPAANTDQVARNLRTPYQDEFTVGFEREIFRETALRLTYIQRKYRDQFQDQDINHLPGDYGDHCASSRNAEGLYVRGEPDGKFDDCLGLLIPPPPGDNGDNGGGGGGGTTPPTPEQWGTGPDGFPDQYIQNPYWGQIFLIGNFNYADYKGVVLEIVRRQFRNWQMDASYTWSRAVGNGEDFRQILGDDQSNQDDETGYQSNDQRHVVKLSATSVTPWGWRFGTSVVWQSGLPYSILRSRTSLDATPPGYRSLASPHRITRIQYPTGERNDRRNVAYWSIDIHLSKELHVGRRMNVQVMGDIFNLLNDNTYIVYNRDLEYGRQINGNNEALRRFGRQFQLGFRFAF